MKKILALVLVVAMVFALSACGKESGVSIESLEKTFGISLSLADDGTYQAYAEVGVFENVGVSYKVTANNENDVRIIELYYDKVDISTLESASEIESYMVRLLTGNDGSMTLAQIGYLGCLSDVYDLRYLFWEAWEAAETGESSDDWKLINRRLYQAIANQSSFQEGDWTMSFKYDKSDDTMVIRAVYNG